MCKKCICLIRVSTLQQDFEAQKKEVVRVAKADGYKDSEIAIVEGKESAIKLKEEQRETISEMKEIINENPSIESVYVFAVDRLARRVSVVISVKDYLLDKGINLVFLNPHKMATMRKDTKTGKMVEDELTALVLMFLAYGAEMEMKLKNIRFEVAKSALKRNGKLYGGIPLYGYVKAEDKSIIPDEDNGTANVVRRIFTDYVNKEKSLIVIFNELVQEGIFKSAKPGTGKCRIHKIIINPAYSGRKPIKGENVYPAIVSEELQDAAIIKCHDSRMKPKTTQKTVYYGKGIVRNMATGHIMTGTRNIIAYRDFESRLVVNVNVIDSILWYEAVELKKIDLAYHWEANKKGYQSEIEKNSIKIETINGLLSEIKSRQSLAFRLLMQGKVSEDVYDEQMKEVETDAKKWEKQLAQLNSINEQYTMMLNNIQETNYNDISVKDVTDDEERKKIIQSVIEEVQVTPLYDKNKSLKIQIVRIPLLKNPHEDSEYYIYWVRGGVVHLEWHQPLKGRIVDISHSYTKRLKKYKYSQGIAKK